ncbi:MAG: 6-phospho-beta-glucosidase [Anaerolineae bacterium]|nr:6-phospho-beta-glucosidase [Anaerolineae bacterium]MDQ7033849.1 6-phospho-beta-glucosidase [Anaerolineae bacterium]
MKLTIIGGGSVRTPRLIPTLIKRAAALDLQELWLMDIQAEKLELIGGLCQAMAEEQGATFKFVLSTDAKEAITDADHVVTSIRPAYEKGRAVDERICFNHGVLGQETTGAAGFAMAMRSAPAILEYARMVEQYAKPNAWVFNFTNPAGLVAQVLHDAGIERVVGICDSANKAQHAVSRFMQIPMKRLHHEVYGLNHLSWTRSVRIDPDSDGQNGEEVLPGLLQNDDFVAKTHMQMFADGLRDWQATFMNEYLHYYYHRDEVLASLIHKEESRGEQVLRLTNDMLEKLKSAQTVDERIQIYRSIMAERSKSYMAHARGGADRKKMKPVGDDEEGYAAVALGCIEAIATNRLLYTGLNVPNNGAINGMEDDDIVEVACWVDSSGIRPIQIGTIPENQLQMMHDVKQYERLASQAILTKSRATAIQAITVHPLVGSYPLAEKLVDAFIDAHQEWIGTWQ